MNESTRLKYWVCFDKNLHGHTVIRSESNPHNAPADCGWGIVLVDGPFDAQESAIQSLQKWNESRQLPEHQKDFAEIIGVQMASLIHSEASRIAMEITDRSRRLSAVVLDKAIAIRDAESNEEKLSIATKLAVLRELEDSGIITFKERNQIIEKLGMPK